MSECPFKLKYGSMPDSRFNKTQLASGTKQEMREHGVSFCMGKQIAKGNIMANPREYLRKR